jgi:hypothetical protein
MSRKFQRKGVAVAALLLALLAATPAHASGPSNWLDVPVLHQAWQWLSHLLPGGAGARQGDRAMQEKARQGVDPNGDPAAATSAPPSDKGAGVDPNG